MKKIFYHLYLTDNHSWTYIFLDQFKCIHDSGLYKKIDDFHIVAVGTQEQVTILKGLVNYFSHIFGKTLCLHIAYKPNKDEELKEINHSKNLLTETLTLKIIWDLVQNKPNHQIMYFHSKGVTGIQRHLDPKSQDFGYERFVNYYYWRKFLDWSVIEKAEDAWKLLNDYDTVGTNFVSWPSMHYSGNYWWANSDYIQTLNDPTDDAWWQKYREDHPALLHLTPRLKDEMWIGSGKTPKMYSFVDHHAPPPISNLGETLITRREYQQ
jgi:hypothetical protein